MEPRKFNSIFPYVNEIWTADALGMQHNPKNGPDLIDSKKQVEVKFLLDKYTKKSWTVQEHQLYYSDEKPFYWAFGTYSLLLPISQINTPDFGKLENIVKQRELWIIEKDWIKQFPASRCTGKTKKSKWDYTFRYPKINYLPEIKQTFPTEKGLIHLTENVNPEHFKHLFSPIPF